MSRILIASHPFDGHVGPLTRLAVHLKRRGHEVRWYTGNSYAKRLADLGIFHYPFSRAKEITAQNLAEHFPEYDSQPMSPRLLELAVRELFFAPIEPQYRDVCAIHAEGFPFDAFICDSALMMSRIVAEKLQPRTYVVFAAPTPAPTSARAAAPFFGFRPARGVLGRVRDWVAMRLHDATMKRGLALFNDLRAREGLPPYAGSGFDLHVARSRAILQIGVPGLDFPRETWPANFRFIGALLPEPRELVLPQALEEKLARYSKLVVVSQGTTDNRDPDKLFAPALAALAGGDQLVVVTTGGRHTQALRERFAQDNVVIEDFVDYGALLPRAALLITNGGFGSVLLALSCGVPLVVAGKLEGKADINARVAYRGLGIDLRTERPSARKLASAVRRVLTDPRYRERVAGLREELDAYDPLAIVDAALAADGILPAEIAA